VILHNMGNIPDIQCIIIVVDFAQHVGCVRKKKYTQGDNESDCVQS